VGVFFGFFSWVQFLRSSSSPKKPLAPALYVVAVYSLFGHKEFRFIYPVLPICLVYAGHGLWYLRQSGWARLYRALVCSNLREVCEMEYASQFKTV